MTSDITEKFYSDDQAYLSKRKQVSEQLGIPDLWEIIDQFSLYAGIQTLGKCLAVYEILKKSLDVPGHIIEFGCWHGANLMFMAKVLQLLQPNTYKYVYGFDSFEGLLTFTDRDPGTSKLYGKYKGDEAKLRALIEFFKMEEWVYIIKGDALETIPDFKEEFPHLMFSLAYIDFDLYEPCRFALEYVAPRLSSGGIIVFDEALTNLWPGEGQALVEFLSKSKFGEFTMHNIAFARQPTVYLIKQ